MEIQKCSKCHKIKPLDGFGKDKRRKHGKRSWCKECESEAKYFRKHGCQKPPPLPKPPDGMKRCSGCKEIKPLSEFYDDARNINTGKQSRCIACFKEYDKSPAGKASTQRYRNSEKGKQFLYRHYHSEKYRARKRAYAKTPKGREIKRRFVTSEKGKQSIKLYCRSEKFKAQQKRYHSSLKGRQTSRRLVLLRLTRKTQAGGSYTLAEWKELCVFCDYRCLACGNQFSFDELTVDHIVPISLGGTSNIDNLQPLCKSCNSSKNNRIIDYRTKKIWWKQLELF